MTTAEIIHVYENSRLQADNFTQEAITAAYVTGLAALQEKAERENPAPLDLEQVKQMRGKPVWCPEIKAYGIIKIYKIGPWADKPFLKFFWIGNEDEPYGVDCEWDIEKRGLTIYPYKPKKEGGGST